MSHQRAAEDDVPPPRPTSTVTDVAVVLGLSREDWIAAYDDAKAYYENIGLKLE